MRDINSGAELSNSYHPPHQSPAPHRNPLSQSTSSLPRTMPRAGEAAVPEKIDETSLTKSKSILHSNPNHLIGMCQFKWGSDSDRVQWLWGKERHLDQTENLNRSMPSWMFQNSFVLCGYSYNSICTSVPICVYVYTPILYLQVRITSKIREIKQNLTLRQCYEHLQIHC